MSAAPSPDAGSFLTRRDDVLVVGVPAEALLARGAGLVFVAAPALTALVWGAYALLEAPSLLTLAASALLAIVLGGVPGVLGALALARAARSRREREVRIDLGERLLERPGHEPEVLRDPERIAVERSGLGWRLVMDGARLVDGVPRSAGRGLALAADALAEAMGAEARVPAAARRAKPFLPTHPRLLAALSYAPVDPVLLPVSLWVLMTAEHPKTRFAAKQSLLLWMVETTVVGVLVVVTAAPLLLIGDRLPSVVGAAIVSCPLLGFAALRGAVRVVAAMRAHRGAVWVIPALGLVSARWAPRLPPRASAPPRAPAPSPARPRASAPPSPPKGVGPWWT